LLERWKQLYATILAYPYLDYVLIAIVLVVGFICLMWARSRRLRKPKEIVAFESGTGHVTVARGAISDLIHRAAANTDGVAKCSSRITVRKGLLKIKLKVHLSANSNLKNVHNTLKGRIGDTLRNTLGIEQMGDIDTVVTGLVGTPDHTPTPSNILEDRRNLAFPEETVSTSVPEATDAEVEEEIEEESK
jgi:hypothetical protein